MSWVDYLWPMMAAVCLTLGLLHLLAGMRSRDRARHLWLALICACVGVMAVMELMSMRATTPAEFARILRWGHVPFAAMIIGIVWFVRSSFGAGNLRLAWAICIVRLLSLVANFATGDNLHFRHLTQLVPVRLWGEATIVTPAGDPNPWLVLGQASLVLLMAYLVQVMRAVWKRGDVGEQRRVLAVCGSMLLFMVMSAIVGVGVSRFGLRSPVSVNPAFVPVLLVISFELGAGILQAAQLAERLKLSEARLRASQSRTAMAVRAADLGLWSWEPARRDRWLSDVGARLLGLPPGESLRWRRLRTRIHPDDRARMLATIGQAMHGSGEFLAEFRLVTGPGPERWLAVRGEVEHRADGRPRASGVLADISERKAADRLAREAALQRDELAHLSRVALLAELSGSLAHELNQPLTAILSNAQAGLRFLAQAPPDLAEVGLSLSNIVENDKRAGDVIRGLRAMLRKEAADHRLLDANEVVEEVLRIVRSDLLNRSIDLQLALAPGLPRIAGDRVQLQQVLLNLLMNGSDAMAGLATGRLLSVRTALGGDHVVVAVSDVGPGIAEDELERIFQPFVTSKAEGMGLGLAVCSSIIKTHGGRLWAANAPGGGATVSFELPVAAG